MSQCCSSCTFCKKHQAAAKERHKSNLKLTKYNKVCEKCFFCKSLCLCPKCVKCPQCCKCPISRGTPTKFLENMGSQGCKPEGSIHLERGLCASLQGQASLNKGTPDSKRLCKPHQRLPLTRSSASSDQEKGSREGQGSNLTSLFQQIVHCPKAEPKVAANLGSQYSKSVFMRKNIQNGDSRDNPDLSTTRGVGVIDRFQRRLLPHSNPLHIPKIPQVPLPEPVVPVSGSSLWPFNSSHGVHCCGQRGQVNGSVTGYKNPPVPRRLVDSSPYQRILPPGNPVPPSPLPGVGLDGKHAKIRTGTPTNLRFCRLPVRPAQRTGQTYSKPLGSPSTKNNRAITEEILPSENLHVSYRSSHCDRETGAPRQTAHETYSVAPQETLESPGISGKGDPNSEVSPSAPAVVDPGEKCPKGSTLTPPTTRDTNLYRRLKRRLGCSLRRLHSKRYLVSARKQVAHKLLRAKSRVVSTKKIPTISARKGRPDCHRQHHSCGIHQQGGRYEVRFTLCPSLAAPMLVQSQTNSTEGQTYSGPSECNCRQVVSPGTGHSDRVVPPSGDL